MSTDSQQHSMSTHTWPHRCENNVGNLHYTLRARCSHSDNWRWCICILERCAFTRYDRPRLADHLGTGWNSNCRRNDVRPGVEEYNFTAGELCKISPLIWANTVAKYLPTFSNTAVMAAVSSVIPSPFAPLSLTLTNWLVEKSVYCGCVRPNIFPDESSREDGLFTPTIGPWVNVPVPLAPTNTFPWPQESIVVVPPTSTVSPVDSTPTATGTLVSLALLMTRDPSSAPLLGNDVRTKIGVLLTVASMMARDPEV